MMGESRNYNATLNAKGLENFVSEEQARRMASAQGQHSLFLVDAHHAKLVIDEDGTQRIHLVIDSAELIPAEQEERVRRFQRALYLARPDQYGQQAFEGVNEDQQTVEDAGYELDAATEEVAETAAHAEADALAAEVLGDPDEPEADAGEPWPGDENYVAPEPSNVVQASFTG